MDKIVKKGVTLLILLMLVLSLVGGLFANVGATFAEKEEEWLKNCSDITFVTENAKKCEDFSDYLKKQEADAKKELDNIKGQIGSISGDIAKDNKVIQALDAEGFRLQKDINLSEALISKKKIDIEKMNQQILVRENDIEEKKELAKDYMIHMQGTSRVNSYYDFLLSADNFVELSRRIEGLNLISKKNTENIVALNIERDKLEEDRMELVFDQKRLEETVAAQKAAIERHKEIQEDTKLRIAKLREKHSALIEAQEAAEAERKLVTDKIASIVEPEKSTGALIRPIASGYRVSGGVWRYSGVSGPSGVHIGIDIAAPVGTALRAPANGIAIARRNDCPTIGGFPSPNCTGYGNYLLMIVNSNGNIYGILYGHIRKGGVLVSNGQAITGGQKVAEVGSSGNSTGAHLHGEVYFLGTDSVSAAYNRWYNGPRNNNFGAGGKNVEYANRCEVKGMKAPCRLNPNTMWGLKVGDRG